MSETNTSEEQPPKAGGKKIIVAAMLVLGTLVGGGAGAFFAGPLLAAKVLGPPAPKPATEGEHAAGDSAQAEEKGHGEEKADKGQGAPAVTYLLENLVLNPAQSGGTRFLMFSVSFSVKDESVVEQMKSRDAEVRDAVLTTLGRKTVEQLADISMRDTMKAELKASVSGLFGKGAVEGIFLPQFVIQ